jgi:hypothetical protein
VYIITLLASLDAVMNDASNCLDELVAELLESARVGAPPVDARQIARELKLTVARDDGQSGRARIVRRARRNGSASVAILVRNDPRVERMQWSIAHELGEAFAVQAFHRLDWDARATAANARELVANQIANRLLLPANWFARDAAACDGDLFALKAIYSTASHELIALRLLDFPPHAITAIFDRDHLTRRLGNLPSRLPPLLPCEREAQRRASALGGHVDCGDGQVSCRAWAIHEPDWKREIIRTEFAELET